jgi:hypothetical protein
LRDLQSAIRKVTIPGLIEKDGELRRGLALVPDDAVRTSIVVKPLSRMQAITIVKEADPKLALPEEELDVLYQDLNWTLSQMGFFVNIEYEPAQAVKTLKALQRILLKLKAQSQPAMQLLKSLAFHHVIKSAEGISPSVCSQIAIDYVEIVLGEVDRISQSLRETNAKDISALIPRLKTDELIRSRLPTIFQVYFKRECGNSHVGPGTRFIRAVLRDAGIRNQRGEIFGAAAIVKCRSRGSRKGLRPYREIRNPWLTTMDKRAS